MFDPYLVRFRKRAENNSTASVKVGDLIAKSTSQVNVMLEGLENAIPVIFINKDKEGETESIMYSYSKNKVTVGKYVTFLEDTYLVYKEVKNLKREDYIDAFKLVKCNITFNFNNTEVKAFFKGALRSQGSDESNLAQDFGVMSYGQSVIMYPSNVGLGVNTPISIGGKGWRTTQIDSTTNLGVTYSALEEYNIPNTTKISENEVEDEPLMMAFAATTTHKTLAKNPIVSGVTLEFPTEDAYISTNQKVKIISRDDNLIKLIIPFGIEEVSISTKQNGIIVSETYKVGG